MFPLYISAVGIIVCMVCSFVATNIFTVKKEKDVENVLKVQLVLTSLFVTIAVYPLCKTYLPETLTIGTKDATQMGCFLCICCGLWGGCLIGFITEYYTSHSYTPVRDVARSTETGAATNIIYGLALGYKSAIAPVMIISVIIFVAFGQAGMYGVALGALGMLSTLATCLSIDVFGPVCDNAGGVAEMCEMPSRVRFKTDALDAAGNTTAAIGKGFAIGSAALVSLALFGAFITHTFDGLKSKGVTTSGEQVNLLEPVVFAFLLYGAMIPYWFSALTMVSTKLLLLLLLLLFGLVMFLSCRSSSFVVVVLFRNDDSTWRPSQCAVRRTLMLTNQETTEKKQQTQHKAPQNHTPLLFLSSFCVGTYI